MLQRCDGKNTHDEPLVPEEFQLLKVRDLRDTRLPLLGCVEEAQVLDVRDVRETT